MSVSLYILLDKGDQMISKRIIIMVMFFCFTLTSFAAAQSENEVQQRSFAIPQHGNLILIVPTTWKHSVRQPPGDLPPTITFTPDKGDVFEVLITPIWSPRNDATFNKPEKVRTLIDNDLKGMLPRAVEKQVNIQEFKGNYGEGYYFLMTDKAPKPGEYPYAVRAGVGVGDLLLSVTVLSRSKNSDGISLTLKALQQAKQR
jgi:hypothetical protein